MFMTLVLCFSVMIFKINHLLSFFILLEMIGLLVVFFFNFLFLLSGLDSWLIIYFICFLGCESALGLVLFVMFSRSYSKDYFYNMSLLKY